MFGLSYGLWWNYVHVMVNMPWRKKQQLTKFRDLDKVPEGSTLISWNIQILL